MKGVRRSRAPDRRSRERATRGRPHRRPAFARPSALGGAIRDNHDRLATAGTAGDRSATPAAKPGPGARSSVWDPAHHLGSSCAERHDHLPIARSTTTASFSDHLYDVALLTPTSRQA